MPYPTSTPTHTKSKRSNENSLIFSHQEHHSLENSAPHYYELSTTQLGIVQPPQLLPPFNNLSMVMVIFLKSDGVQDANMNVSEAIAIRF